MELLSLLLTEPAVAAYVLFVILLCTLPLLLLFGACSGDE